MLFTKFGCDLCFGLPSVFQGRLQCTMADSVSGDQCATQCATQSQLADRVCKLWNQKHTRLIATDSGTGYGGYLRKNVAEAQLKYMTDFVYANHSDPAGIMASAATHQTKRSADVPKKVGGGRPRKQKKVLKRFEELTESDLEELTCNDLHHYTQQLEGKKPKYKKDSTELICKHIKKNT